MIRLLKAGDRGHAEHGWPHPDREIISCVPEGELAHKDSMGNGSIIRQGGVQTMQAGDVACIDAAMGLHLASGGTSELLFDLPRQQA